MQIVGVKFDLSDNTEFFDVGENVVKLYDKVLCQTENGICFGTVNSVNANGQEVEQKVLRVATQKDIEEYQKICKKQDEVLAEETGNLPAPQTRPAARFHGRSGADTRTRSTVWADAA